MHLKKAHTRRRLPSKQRASLRKPRAFSGLAHRVGTTLQPFAHVSERMMQRQFARMVFSPVCGVVDYVDAQPSQYEIGVYLRGYNDVTYDPHSIFAPVGGTIRKLSYQSKAFMRMLKHSMLIDASIRSKHSPKRRTNYHKDVAYPPGTLLIKTRERKNGVLTVKIGRVTFAVEVGHRYITKSLALYQRTRDVVFAGQHIGDILIGSYCVLKLPRPCELFIREGDNLKGGVSSNPLARLAAMPCRDY